MLDVNQNLLAVVARTDGSGEILDYFVYGAAGLVSKITPAGQAFTYHFDPTGNAIAMSDSSENLVNTYAYTPYGKTTRQESIDNPFEYVGKFGVMAEDNGLNYMRARFYHPGIRRFISQDTVWGEVSSPQSLNLYAYVEGNPVMRVDPSGLYLEKENFEEIKSLFSSTLDTAKSTYDIMENTYNFRAFKRGYSSLNKIGNLKGMISKGALYIALQINQRNKLVVYWEGLRHLGWLIEPKL